MLEWIAGLLDLWIVEEGGVRFRVQDFIFWPYQALPGLTGLDTPEAVEALKR